MSKAKRIWACDTTLNAIRRNWMSTTGADETNPLYRVWLRLLLIADDFE
ncbi:MAG: hypothetical protein KGN01_08260 [Patescibacteria group bacterium]|nr:hypothetical protein [Patescibacteria group bacterium]